MLQRLDEGRPAIVGIIQFAHGVADRLLGIGPVSVETGDSLETVGEIFE